MSTIKVNLWKVEGKDTPMARLYSKLPPHRHPTKDDLVWVPISLIEHTSQNLGSHHIVTLCERVGMALLLAGWATVALAVVRSLL